MTGIFQFLQNTRRRTPGMPDAKFPVGCKMDTDPWNWSLSLLDGWMSIPSLYVESCWFQKKNALIDDTIHRLKLLSRFFVTYMINY